MHQFRSHTCGALRASDIGERTRLAGWIHSKRDHGGILFVDLRDHYGITQVVFSPEDPFFQEVDHLPKESVIRVDGAVRQRPEDTLNPQLATGEVEVRAEAVEILSRAEVLPFPVADEIEIGEALRLEYRFLDLRRKGMHENVLLRSRIISSIRQRMLAAGFHEFQTPILTASSPEGARDYLVPSRLHPGKFYALPQAPQMFKQLLMVAGFDRYFQIAPCFRDEDARADRSPGEFYQLDLEMSFVEQEDVFRVVEEVMYGLFTEFGAWPVSEAPFERIPYAESMLRYGSDKPDLRFGLEIQDVSSLFAESGFRVFRNVVEKGGVVRMLALPDGDKQSRTFLDKLEKFIKGHGGSGLAYLVNAADGVRGPIAGVLSEEEIQALLQRDDVAPGTAMLFVADAEDKANDLAGKLRLHLADLLDLRQAEQYRFCWIVDFPMYEWDAEAKRWDFGHNPFSMPQGGLEALETQEPGDILAEQYDLVCNGVELSSGAIRNHDPQIMYRAFAIAGYERAQVDENFGGLIRALKFGAPPHGGLAPGIDRIVMLLAREPNLREVVAFPMTQNAQDLMMGAPAPVSKRQLDELSLRLKPGIEP
ncbi:MAG: aspartate--tRNA ligase [Proteobacteria bacterium]|nr:aspartate--tRNA ligase [Pseudomonadota bacterium]